MDMNKFRGGVFAFEGRNAVGKTTSIKLVKAELEGRGYEVNILKTPSGLIDEQKCRFDPDPNVRAKLNAEDKIIVLTAAKILADSGMVVLVDRAIISALAFNGTDGIGNKETYTHLTKSFSDFIKSPKMFKQMTDYARSFVKTPGGLVNFKNAVNNFMRENESGRLRFNDILPDVHYLLKTDKRLVAENVKSRAALGDAPDLYESRDLEEAAAWEVAEAYYENIFFGQMLAIDSCEGKTKQVDSHLEIINNPVRNGIVRIFGELGGQENLLDDIQHSSLFKELCKPVVSKIVTDIEGQLSIYKTEAKEPTVQTAISDYTV